MPKLPRAILYKYGGFNKSQLCDLLDISYATLRKWIRECQLPIEEYDRANEPFSCVDVLTIIYAWVGIQVFSYSYNKYRTKVVDAGHARSFEVVFKERTGGGDLKTALTAILPEITHPGHQQALKYLLDHLKEQENENRRNSNASKNGQTTDRTSVYSAWPAS
ncbi:hypothetical protein NG798_27490 [Ancylothrix sp. C2]|uniref:hypothetical protein n=1 Tax=Ancylothrix sp. D3o TaxID=2953691 RepID=UPI0021BA7FA8|nr:hypothetical protein [Ancylothrix sp. D3o]MCT7953545.1 hypothetical protein [Ancylothrix sp. D3o]